MSLQASQPPEIPVPADHGLAGQSDGADTPPLPASEPDCIIGGESSGTDAVVAPDAYGAHLTPFAGPGLHEQVERTRPLVQQVEAQRTKRVAFRDRLRCRKCDEGRKHTVVTFSGTPKMHVYQCGSTLDITGRFDQARRCKRIAERKRRHEGNASD